MKGFSLKSEEIQELRAAHKEALNRKPVCSAAEYGAIKGNDGMVNDRRNDVNPDISYSLVARARLNFRFRGF